MSKTKATAMLGFLGTSMASLTLAVPNLGWFIGNHYGNQTLGLGLGAMGAVVASSIGKFAGYGFHGFGIRLAAIVTGAL